VIVDGASSDGTEALVEQLVRTGVAIGKSEPDGGIYDAMNKGIAMASGAHVLFLNAGDELAAPEAVSEVAHRIEEAGEARERTLFYGNWLVRFKDRSTLFRRARPGAYARQSMPASHQSMLFPMGFLRDHQYDTSYVVCGDYNLVARAYVSGIQFAPIDTTVAVFEAGGFSSRMTQVQLREAIRVQTEVLRVSPAFLLRSALRRIATVYGMRAISLLKRRRMCGGHKTYA
jgi:putative colanic acid biosynthesis glycosyltransferase